MKISRKILISNLIIGGIATFLLSLMIVYVINDFIRDNVFANLENEVNLIAEITTDGNNKFLISDKEGTRSAPFHLPLTRSVSKFKRITSQVLFILDGDGNLINEIDFDYEQATTDKFYSELNDMDQESINRLKIEGQDVVIYKKVVEINDDGELKTFQLIGMVYNNDISDLLIDMIIPVLLVLVLILVMSFVLSSILGNTFTKPVAALIQMTNQIAGKESVQSKISSGDEFQLIGKALEEMSEEISLKDLESKQFYEHVSHDLKTPLTIISGYAEGVNGGIFDDNKEPLDKIVHQCDSLKNQIENIIYLSQIETRKQDFTYREVELEAIISKVLDNFEAVFLTKDIDVEYQPCTQTMVWVDEDKIIRSFNNILSNSIKWASSEIRISLKDKGSVLQVIFEDNGPGFNKQVLEDPFTGYKKSKDNGNGIGLMIVYRIMETHGIGLELMNTDYGACVVFEFPQI